jgi:hypothetical protein
LSPSNRLAKLIERGEFESQAGVIAEQKVCATETVFARLGDVRYRLIKDALPEVITFDEIRIVVADLKRRASNSSAAPKTFESMNV